MRYYSVVYCNYDSKQQKTSILWLLEPIDYKVGIGLGLSVIAASEIPILIAQKFKKLRFQFGRRLLNIFSIFLRQALVESDGIHPIVIIALMFTSTIVLSYYEYFVTSSLIVPETIKLLSTIREFIENGYVMHYQNLFTRFHFNHTAIIQHIVSEQGLNYSDVHNSFQLLPDSNYGWGELFVNSTNPNNSILKDFRGLHEIAMKSFQNSHLEGRYNCYLAKDFAMYDYANALFQSSLFPEFKSLFALFTESGLTQIWRSLEVFYSSNRKNEKEIWYREITARPDMFSFQHLWQFFAVYYGFILVAFLLFVLKYHKLFTKPVGHLIRFLIRRFFRLQQIVFEGILLRCTNRIEVA